MLFLIGLILCLGFSSRLRASDAAPSEAQVKAAFLLNFPKYVEWPVTAFSETNSPIVVAILDADSVANEFSNMSKGRIIDGHPIRLQRVTGPEQCRGCQILFVGSGQSRKLPDLLPRLREWNVLLVGESDDFLDVGGMINLPRRERRIVLEVNLDSIRAGGLKVSSKLLALATVKGGKK
jgi:YfiR/HmsC-like